MSKIKPLLRHCRSNTIKPFEFNPAEKHLLFAEANYKHIYKYQELLTGICPKCNMQIMAWLGIGFDGNAQQYYAISTKKFELWQSRIRSSKVRDDEPVIDPRKHSKHKANSVLGSVREKNSGKWMLKQVAVAVGA